MGMSARCWISICTSATHSTWKLDVTQTGPPLARTSEISSEAAWTFWSIIPESLQPFAKLSDSRRFVLGKIQLRVRRDQAANQSRKPVGRIFHRIFNGRKNHSRARRGVGFAINQNEAARPAIIFITVEEQRLRRGDPHHADFVHRKTGRRTRLQRVHVHPMLYGFHSRGNR